MKLYSQNQMESIKINPLLDTLRLEKISDSEYFSQKYNGYISNSRLSLIDPSNEGTPEKFFQGLSKNGIYTDSIRLGSIVHGCALQPELFHLCDSVDLPTAKLGFVCEYLYNKYLEIPSIEAITKASDHIDYYKGKLTPNRILEVQNKYRDFWHQRVDFEASYTESKEVLYSSPKLRETAQNCLKALDSNSEIQKLLHPKNIFGEDLISENELAILLDVEVIIPDRPSFTLRLKAKLDNFTIDTFSNEICVNDIKTLGKIVSEFNTNFEKYHYYRELAIYSWLLSLCASKFYNMNNPKITSNCLVVSTIPQYYTKVYKVTKGDFNKGWQEFIYLLKLVAHYYDKGYRFS